MIALADKPQAQVDTVRNSDHVSDDYIELDNVPSDNENHITTDFSVSMPTSLMKDQKKFQVKRAKPTQDTSSLDNCVDVSVKQKKAVKPKKLYQRDKKKCPVKKCRAFVMSLTRHLRLHGWSEEHVLSAVHKYNLRKPYKSLKSQPPKFKDYHKMRQCPIDGCNAVIKRLPPHLKGHHSIFERTTLKYWQDLARKRVRDSKWLDSQISDDSCSDVEKNFDSESEEDEDSDELEKDDDHCSITDDIESQNINSDEHLNAIDSINDSNSELNNFEQWMLSPDGGMKAIKSSRQHAFQVKTLISVVDPELNRSSKLLNSQLLSDKFMLKYVKEKKFLPGTTKSYLNSALHWFKYLLANKNMQLSADLKISIQGMCDRVRRWISSLRSQSQKRFLEKQDQDFSRLITCDEIKRFNDSPQARQAVKLLGIISSVGKKHHMTASEYVLVRDFLLCKIVFNNANRSGVLSNVTIENFESAKVVNNHHVVSVPNHKTSSTHGPAKIILSSVLFAWLSTYANTIRPLVLVNSEIQQDELFLSYFGEAMSSGQISKAMPSVWAKAGLKSAITCTLMRKSAVSAIHQHVPDSRINLADLMSHRLETATKSFRLSDKNRTTVAASQTLTQVMQGQHELDDTVFPRKRRRILERHSSDEENGDITVGTHDKTTLEVSPNCDDRMELNNNNGVQELQSDDEFGSVVPPSSNAFKQRLFSCEQIGILTRLCKSVIESGPISEKRLTDELSITSGGKVMLKCFTMAQIISRVKYERLKLRKK